MFTPKELVRIFLTFDRNRKISADKVSELVSRTLTGDELEFIKAYNEELPATPLFTGKPSFQTERRQVRKTMGVRVGMITDPSHRKKR